MAAALGHHLIFEHDAGKAGAGVALHGALDIERVAKAGVAIADQRDRDRRAKIAALIEQFPIGNQAGIRQTKAGGRYGKAAHERDWETGLFDQLRGQGIMAAGHEQQTGLGEQGAQTISRRGHGEAFLQG